MRRAKSWTVSVLFSEPKIPQISAKIRRISRLTTFQCSSASRKFLKIPRRDRAALRRNEFQCSSASRKFLNRGPDNRKSRKRSRFSALQRAENSSSVLDYCVSIIPHRVSVLFSEPKIPQSAGAAASPPRADVSVLFSEPKIPQYPASYSVDQRYAQFQCSSASRKFLNDRKSRAAATRARFSALQRAENSSIHYEDGLSHERRCFSALQRAENSSIQLVPAVCINTQRFSALQRAENSSIPSSERVRPRLGGFSALQRAENSSICKQCGLRCCWRARFSALQRAENSSTRRAAGDARARFRFSALQRAENSSIPHAHLLQRLQVRFSALQRAENSSRQVPAREDTTNAVSVLFSEPKIPQLSTTKQHKRI